ncbi:MAG TPA: hypothetical protein VMY34_03930 [Acidimicrobiales bacterium]|nr:hypothetical protein [Acidimicrobiales bacterium]
MSLRPAFFIVCHDTTIAAYAVGPFDTRADAVAEDELMQRDYATRCPNTHRVVRRGDVPRNIELRPARTTEVERRQQQARSAATRSAR